MTLQNVDDAMSTFALGPVRVRRSGFGAMQLAGAFAGRLPRGQNNPVLNSPVVVQTAARLGATPAQVALQWLLQLAPHVLLIPGTGSAVHLRENLAAEKLTLDDDAVGELNRV